MGAKAAVFCHVFASGAPGRTDGRSNGLDSGTTVLTYDRVGAADARHPAACPKMPGSDRTELWSRGTARPGRVWLESKVAPTVYRSISARPARPFLSTWLAAGGVGSKTVADWLNTILVENHVRYPEIFADTSSQTAVRLFSAQKFTSGLLCKVYITTVNPLQP
jgi:hypothetical protein